MVFAASLSLVGHKAMANKCVQKSIGYIMSVLPLNPSDEASGMEVLLLGPMDFKGAASKGLNDALASKHPDICAIYFFNNDKDKALCTAPGVNMKMCKRTDAAAVKDAVSEFYGNAIKERTDTYDSQADKVLAGDRNPTPPRAEPTPTVPTPTVPEPEPESTPTIPEPEPEPIPATPTPEPAARKLPPSPTELVEACKSFEDWDVFTKQLEKDSVISDALLRSSEFQGVRQMMEVYSVKMNDVMADPKLTPEQRMQAIKEFGHNRQSLAAAANSKMVDDWLKLWHSVCTVAESIVRDRLATIQAAVTSTTVQREQFLEQQVTGVVDAEKALGEYAVELVNIQARLTQLWAFAYNESVSTIGEHLNDKLPSDSEYINAMLGESIKEFRTDNAESLINRIFAGLKDGHISLSQVQDEIAALSTVCFKMLQKYSDISVHQKNVMDLLRANHVENIVIRDTLLKDCFRVFVGTSGTGLSATATIFAGMQARKGNTVLIDLTGHSQYERYGQTPIDLEKFMAERVQQPLLFVTSSNKMDPEQISLMMEELKARMTYYRHLIVVLDAEQKEELDQIGREALTIGFVTNCTSDSLAAISVAYRNSKEIPNVGRMLCAIDAPVDATILIKTLGLDISDTRLVLIPYMRDVRKMAITHDNPVDYGDILQVYEAAFRV